jgi:very-short-patch-repair endonuclease
VIELDGYHHLGQIEYDARRTAWLKSKGYRVIRFWNHQVMTDVDGVLRDIRAAFSGDA